MSPEMPGLTVQEVARRFTGYLRLQEIVADPERLKRCIEASQSENPPGDVAGDLEVIRDAYEKTRPPGTTVGRIIIDPQTHQLSQG